MIRSGGAGREPRHLHVGRTRALIGAGLTNQEVADRLFISLATVKDHNHNVFRKTGVRSRVELAILFRPRG